MQFQEATAYLIYLTTTEHLPSTISSISRLKKTHPHPHHILHPPRSTDPLIYSTLIKTISQPLTHRPQTLPSNLLVRIRHQRHHSGLDAQFLELAALVRTRLDEPADVVAGDGEDLLIVVPALAEDFREFLGNFGLVFRDDFGGVFAPEGGVAVRGRPAEVAGEDFGGVLVVGGLAAGVFGEHVCQGGEVVEEVLVAEMAGFEVGEEGGEADGYSGGEKGGAVGGWGEEV